MEEKNQVFWQGRQLGWYSRQNEKSIFICPITKSKDYSLNKLFLQHLFSVGVEEIWLEEDKKVLKVTTTTWLTKGTAKNEDLILSEKEFEKGEING